MEFAIFSNNGRPRRTVADSYEEDLYEIVVADQVGFREAWISEHNFPAELVVCKAAALTEQILLGPAVRPLPLHHPVQVVVEANACDHLTHGRYLFGLGLGLVTLQRKMGERGQDYAQARAIMRESIDFILQAWRSDGPFDFHGQFFHGENVDILPKPFQRPHPPIAIACSATEATVDLAGEMGFMPLFSPTDHPTRVRAAGDAYCAAAAAAGQAVSRGTMRVGRFVYVADSYAQAREDLLPTMQPAIVEESKFAPHRYSRYLPPGGRVEDLTFDDLAAAGRFIVGSPDDVYARLVEFYEQAGGFGVLMLHMGRDYGTREGRERSLRLFAEHVAPRLRALDPDRAPVSAGTR